MSERTRIILTIRSDDGTDDVEVEMELASTIEDVRRGQLYFAQPGATDAQLAELRIAGKDALEDELRPHTVRGVKVKRSAAKGGRERAGARKGPPDDVLCRQVAQVHERNLRISWTEVCKIVGKKTDLSGRTVQRRAAPADWRKS